MPEPRVNVNIRLNPDGIKAVDRLAEEEQRTRSQMLRILIAEAVSVRAKRVKR
jgi:predicted transcriptional regulator